MMDIEEVLKAFSSSPQKIDYLANNVLHDLDSIDQWDSYDRKNTNSVREIRVSCRPKSGFESLKGERRAGGGVCLFFLPLFIFIVY
ncbi:hypothetical protein [Bartonella clarridgeiae]|nr:hypothetical protein [Bartonella clarridgeiae]